ncbi:DUF302 domain-containing protein [Aromatoleum bremense]|uniref:DUF302 domain-containing protein n=1 Tax=Aromatoleum bremense TaxID=76115 RepID=A0ABX1NVP9_9RHOO|nr:DUF302 domain-containing protein [Aromatoleum bremense]NMG16099.1 DUF302 domain-containing protein [Aromatoleum bremense]QTQ30211.1 putative protein DUf302 [Aromatoleum bremense]
MQRFPNARFRAVVIVLAALASLLAPLAGAAPTNGLRTIATSHSFPALQERLERAVEKHGLAVVAAASASRGAAARGVKIPGNSVVMVFRNDYAVRMLEASVPAGIEAPLRYYVTENADGTATLSWRTPTSVFGPYGSERLDALARELDPIFEAIGHDASQ